MTELLILQMVQFGYSIRTILSDKRHMPSENTFYRWLREDTDFKNKYIRARHRQVEFYNKKIDGLINKPLNIKPGTRNIERKLKVKERIEQVDAIKWQYGRLKPKKYVPTLNKQL